MAKHKPYGTYEKYWKRPLYLLCGLAAVAVFWWLYIILAGLVSEMPLKMVFEMYHD
jgi:hypothetical protein